MRYALCSTSVMQIQDLVDTQHFSHESTKFILDKSSRICMFHLLNLFLHNERTHEVFYVIVGYWNPGGFRIQ